MTEIRPEIQIEYLEKRISDGETYLRVRAIPKESRTDDDQRALLRFQIARRMHDLNLDKKPSAEEYLQMIRDQRETLIREQLKEKTRQRMSEITAERIEKEGMSGE